MDLEEKSKFNTLELDSWVVSGVLGASLKQVGKPKNAPSQILEEMFND